MAKLTLLDMVQDIANDLETDEINSISDTIESVQIAQIVKTSFFEMIASRNWPHLKRTFQLTSSSDPAYPTHMRLPEDVKELIMVSYDKKKSGESRDKYQEIYWVEPEEFLYKSNQRNIDNSNVDSITDFGGVPFNIYNDRAPTYFTSFDDEWIVADAYDSAVDSVLQTSKTQALGYISPTWSHTDTAIPDLPEEAFPALLEEAKSTAFVVLKQMPNEKAEQKAGRQHRRLARKAWRVDGGVRYPNYGRKRNRGSVTHNPLFDKDN
jgi:hypothetical protein